MPGVPPVVPVPLDAVLERLAPHFRPMTEVLAHTHAALIEVCGLTVADVDLTADPPYVAITATLHTRPYGLGLERRMLKSPRHVELSTPRLIMLVTAACGDREPAAPLFTTPDGDQVSPAMFLNRVWNPAARAAREELRLAEVPRLANLRQVGGWV